MDSNGEGSEFVSVAAHVSLSAFSPHPFLTPRHLSTSFSDPVRAVPPARKKLAWLSLEGRLVGAEEAASARTIGGDLSPEEAAAWELFTPMQRVLVVATVAAATAESKKSRFIAQLRKSVEIRDQVLLDMQQKLDDLCEQMNSLTDQPRDCDSKFCALDEESCGAERLENEGVRSHGFNHQGDKPSPQCRIVPLKAISSNENKVVVRTDTKRSDMFFACNILEQEERRMSDLSDFCPSVTSSMDIQFSALAAEQDFYNLRKECEEKDDIIKELTASVQASNVASSKRITELEDIVRRKNMVTTKMKKDMVVLEQKVIQLTRLRRSSFVVSDSSDSKFPFMSNNLLYDMSSSSSSSSDSDCPNERHEQQIQSSVSQRKYDGSKKCHSATTESKITTSTENSISLGRSRGRQQQRPRTLLKENILNHGSDCDMVLRPRQSASSEGDSKQMSRRLHQDSRRTVPQRRWV